MRRNRAFIVAVVFFGVCYYIGEQKQNVGAALGIAYYLWSIYMGIRAAMIGAAKGYRFTPLWGTLWGWLGLGWAPYLLYRNAPLTPYKGAGPKPARSLKDMYDEHYAAINAVQEVGKQPWEIVPYQAASPYPAYMVRCIGVDESDTHLYDESQALTTATRRNWDVFTDAKGLTASPGYRHKRA